MYYFVRSELRQLNGSATLQPGCCLCIL